METEITVHDTKKDLVVRDSAENLLTLAIEKEASIDTIERLVALMERQKANIAREQYFEAYAKFQQICPPLRRESQVDYTTKTGGRVQYKFIELDTMCLHIKEALKETGLTYRWKIKDIEGGRIEVSCLITHIGGHTEETSLSAAPDDSGGKNSIQQRGSTVSYLKRYTLDSALGLSSASDTDGRGAGAGKDKKKESGGKTDVTQDNQENATLFSTILKGIGERKGVTLDKIKQHYIFTPEQEAKILLAIKAKTTATT